MSVQIGLTIAGVVVLIGGDMDNTENFETIDLEILELEASPSSSDTF